MAEPALAQQTSKANAATPQQSAATRAPQGAAPAHLGIARLQQSVGNQGIYRLLQTRAIQPKLTVGPVDDEYEREADRVADEILRMPDPSAKAQRVSPRLQRLCPECEEEEERQAQRAPIHIQRLCSACEQEHAHRTPDLVQRMCPECEKESHRQPVESELQRALIPLEEDHQEEEEEQTAGGGGVIRTKRPDRDPPDASAELATYVQSSRHGGQPLPQAARATFESRFGQDFGGVRVHTGTRASEAAAEINALAFTTGSDIYFGAGRFSPGTATGDRLLAHELTHVVQQRGGREAAVQRKTAGHCADSADVDEKRDEVKAAGRAAHEQIQEAFAAVITSEAEMPRATKEGNRVGAIPIQPGSRQPILQRQADISKAPSSLPCSKEAGPGHPLGLNYKFAQSKADLSAADKADIADIVRVDYVKYGVPDKEYVHGFASVEGTQEFNWQLSCARAEAIKAELVRNGAPAAKITTVAHGESTEFSATNLSENRRAIIGNLPVNQPQPVPPPTPTPTTTPTKTSTFDMTIDGCNRRPFVQRNVVNAVMAAYAKVITSGCIKSESLKEKILSEFDGLNVECEQDGGDCGMAFRLFTQTVNLYPSALDPNTCGPLESTILHEIVHLTELLPTGTWNPFGHGILPEACEKSCFGVGSGDASKCK